jgi:peptidoglycan/xylan/chitin deacetylase (PgdA/CDA1 family)
MLVVLMFHQIVPFKSGAQNNKELKQFEAYISYLNKEFSFSVPGDPVCPNKISICLTFDDAYYDFYHFIFPILRKYDIKAILGIPTDYIQDTTQISASTRLSVPYPNGLEASEQDKVPLCTWIELKQMTDSGIVIPASHSHTHANLSDSNINFEQEVIKSKNLIEQKLDKKCNSFIYPYGKFTKTVNKQVANYYDHCLRIGSATNKTWQPNNKLIYRIDADHFWPNNVQFTSKILAKFKRKYWLNKLRFK